MLLEDLMFAVNDNTLVALFDNETGELIQKPMPADEMGYYSGGFNDCVVMDVHVEDNVLNICIEV